MLNEFCNFHIFTIKVNRN